MDRLVFATNNKHKLEEIRYILGTSGYEILSAGDCGFTGDIPETAPDLEGNALQKARFIHQQLNFDCFADDTGLEVEALGGAPGVYSARYAGEGKSFDDNINKLLKALEGQSNRKARFVTVIALIFKGSEYIFRGEIEGEILTERHGNQGFGYDPVFRPFGYNRTFAEMCPAEKNGISHRYKATAALADFLISANK